MDSPIETGIEISNDSSGWPHNSNSLEEIPTDHNASSSPVTPKSERIPVALNFGSVGSSDVTPNHGSDSSYSEFDAEAEAFYSSFNHCLVSPEEMDSHELADKQLSYEELMNRFVECEEELRITTLKLQDSEQLIEKRESTDLLAENLHTELETEKRRVLDLQIQVVDLETKLSDSSFEFQNELEMNRECLVVSEAEILKLKTDIAGLLEKQTFLEDLIKHSDEEKLEMESKEMKLQTEIQELNKDFNKNNLRYDMLMAEKDGVSAESDYLKAEMRSRDIEIEQMKEELNQMTEFVSESRTAKNTVEELKAMIKELEKEVELQRNVISEGEEEKLEAIRQLCFSLDHYKSGYRQLLRFLSSKNGNLSRK